MDRDDTGDPDAPPSAEEVAAAEALRMALAPDAPPTGSGVPTPAHDRDARAAADFARAVSLAHSPRPIADAEHRLVLAQAIARGEARRAESRGRRRRNGAVVGFAGALALAAAVALFLRSAPPSAPPLAAAAAIAAPRVSFEPLIPVRSTQPLFREPFARTGGESARIDRIATARARDLRDNRFAAWRVK